MVIRYENKHLDVSMKIMSFYYEAVQNHVCYIGLGKHSKKSFVFL